MREIYFNSPQENEFVMTNDKVRNLIVNHIEENYPHDVDKILLADGFEEAFVGVVESFGLVPRACYDYNKCIQILMRPSDMEYEDAVEFFEFNVEQCYVGEHTPAFIKQIQI